MASKKMTITKENVTSLDATAKAKFATPAIPGRVLNIDCETDGSGTAEIQLKHPDGSVESLATVTAPTLKTGENLSLRVRVCTAIRKKDEVAEIK